MIILKNYRVIKILLIGCGGFILLVTFILLLFCKREKRKIDLFSIGFRDNPGKLVSTSNTSIESVVVFDCSDVEFAEWLVQCEAFSRPYNVTSNRMMMSKKEIIDNIKTDSEQMWMSSTYEKNGSTYFGTVSTICEKSKLNLKVTVDVTWLELREE